MNITELSPISSGALPFYNFKNHLRMGTGFAEENLQYPLLEAYLRAAITTIESKLGISVITRDFSWSVTSWRYGDRQMLPLRPVTAINSVKSADQIGSSSVVDSDTYVLVTDTQKSMIRAVRGSLAQIPSHGTAVIEFQAGYGSDWDDIPNDLAQAVLLLASYFYENRIGAPLASGVLPASVMGLIEPYRAVRISGVRP